MPPANSGSKGALITWTVVATVFGIVCAVMALIFYVGKNDAETRLGETSDRMREVLPESELQSATVGDLRSRRTEAGSNASLLNYAVLEASRLAEQAVGTTDVQAAQAQAQQVVGEVSTEIEAQPANLAEAARQAVQQVRDLRREVASRDQSLEELRQNLQQQQEQAAQQQQQLEQQVAAAREEAQAATAAQNQARGELETTLASIVAELDRGVGEAGERLREVETQLRDALADNTDLQTSLGKATALLTRPIGGEQMITEPDGKVIRAPSNNRLTIDLGRRQGIARGMTFGVYDSVRGVPAVSGDSNDPELPTGKAAIEVTEVRETSAQARVLRTTPGEVVRDGDLIANLAFDRNVPVRFRVFGDFDLENDGNASADDNERLRALVREFGGTVVDDVTVDTDVVVLGVQPELPDYSPQQLEDPVKRDELFRAQQALDAYNAILNRARELNKTIVNQNQLLYYIGYFEQAGR